MVNIYNLHTYIKLYKILSLVKPTKNQLHKYFEDAEKKSFFGPRKQHGHFNDYTETNVTKDCPKVKIGLERYNDPVHCSQFTERQYTITL